MYIKFNLKIKNVYFGPFIIFNLVKCVYHICILDLFCIEVIIIYTFNICFIHIYTFNICFIHDEFHNSREFLWKEKKIDDSFQWWM